VRKDHFIEGQVSIRSPKARNDLNMLKLSQKIQAERLSIPRQKSSEWLFQDTACPSSSPQCFFAAAPHDKQSRRSTTEFREGSQTYEAILSRSQEKSKELELFGDYNNLGIQMNQVYRQEKRGPNKAMSSILKEVSKQLGHVAHGVD